MKDKDFKPMIWVSNLRLYNEGFLNGAWIDCTLGEEHILERVHKICGNDEYSIDDYQGFYGIDVTCESFKQISAIAETLQDLFYEGYRYAFGEFYNDYGRDIDRALDLIEDKVIGVYESDIDFIENYLDETCFFEGVPDHVIDYFDYEKYYRDQFLNGVFATIRLNSRENLYYYAS